MKDFATIFDIGINFFVNRGAQISLQEFLEDLSNKELDFTKYEKCKYMIYAMIGLKPVNEQEERESILAALDNNHNLEVTIQLNPR